MSGRQPHIVSVMTTQSHGGAEYANVDLLDALAARGWRATLLTNLPDLAAGTRVIAHRIDLGPKLSRRDVRRVVTGFPQSTRRLQRAIAAEHVWAPVDVTLLHFKKEQLMTPLLRGSLPGRLVWAEWGPLPLPMRQTPIRQLYAAAARAADHILAVSEGTAASLAEAGVPPARISVLAPITTDVAFDQAARARVRAAWGATDGTFVIGCVSRLTAGKRIDVLIDAVARMDGDVRLIIAGSGDRALELRDRSEPLGDRVRFLPTVRGRVSEVLSGFDVQVFSPQAQEGVPRSVMLGMRMGLSVIATGPEGAGDLLGPEAVAHPAHDPATVAALLARRRNDPALRQREGDALRAVAQNRFEPGQLAAQAERILLGR